MLDIIEAGVARKKRIYIAGKISGLPAEEVVAKFRVSQIALETLGFLAVNPVEHCAGCGLTADNDWIDFMECCLNILMLCDGIYLQEDWQDSVGARIEFHFAKILLRYKSDFQFFWQSGAQQFNSELTCQ